MKVQPGVEKKDRVVQPGVEKEDREVQGNQEGKVSAPTLQDVRISAPAVAAPESTPGSASPSPPPWQGCRSERREPPV